MRKPNARDRILTTAGELFHRYGYTEVGVNEIVERAQTAKASFYQHFPSKQALCEAWLQGLHQRSEARNADILASPEPVAERVADLFAHLREFLESRDYRGCPYSNTGAVSIENCPGIVERILEHKQSSRDFFRRLAGQHFEDPAEASAAGDRLFVLYSGAATEAQNFKSPWPVEAAAAAAVQLLRP